MFNCGTVMLHLRPGLHVHAEAPDEHVSLKVVPQQARAPLSLSPWEIFWRLSMMSCPWQSERERQQITLAIT
jgi:hypothetical protein